MAHPVRGPKWTRPQGLTRPTRPQTVLSTCEIMCKLMAIMTVMMSRLTQHNPTWSDPILRHSVRHPTGPNCPNCWTHPLPSQKPALGQFSQWGLGIISCLGVSLLALNIFFWYRYVAATQLWGRLEDGSCELKNPKADLKSRGIDGINTDIYIYNYI